MVILANQTLNCIATKQTVIKDVGQRHLTGGGQELRKIKKVIGANMGGVYRFTAYSCGNETYKRLAHLLDRTVCLFRQQEIRERVGNKGREDLYLTIRFIMKIKRNIFIKQLLTNC